MATLQPATERRTRTFPAFVPWLVVGVVPMALAAVGFIVTSHISGSAALTRCPPPTPTAFATSGGVPAIKPDKHLATLCLGPSTPAFTAAEAAALAAKYPPAGVRLLGYIPGSKINVISVKFMSAAAADKLLGTDFVLNGLSANQVLCVVLVSAQSVGTGSPPVPAGSKPATFKFAYDIYDGHTGNLYSTLGTDAEM